MVLSEGELTQQEGPRGKEQELEDERTRRMHSFDRRIKLAHKELNPDLDANVPSYMRQTCASLVKRSSFKIKNLETLDPRCAKPKSSKDRTHKRSKSSVGSERRRSGSRSSSRRSTGSLTPRSELSMVAESMDGSPTPSEADPPRSSSESIIRAVESLEPEGDAEDMSSMMEACFDDVIHDALIKGETSLDIKAMHMDMLHETAIMNSETGDDKSEVIRDDTDSFCYVYDSDDGKSTEIAVPLSDFEMTNEHVHPMMPLTPTSDHGEDVFEVMHEAKWLEDEEEEQVKCHQLTDILASFTDSEYGDMPFQSTLDSIPHLPEDSSLKSFNGTPNVQIPLHKIPMSEDVNIPLHHVSMDDEITFLTGPDRKLKSAQAFKVGTPGFLMMLGGNVIAGVVGAAIASAGMQSSAQHRACEVEGKRRSEGDPSRDWFFESTTLGQVAADDVYQ